MSMSWPVGTLLAWVKGLSKTVGGRFCFLLADNRRPSGLSQGHIGDSPWSSHLSSLGFPWRSLDVV